TSRNDMPRIFRATRHTVALELLEVSENRLFRARHKAFRQYRIDARDDRRRASVAVPKRVDDLELALAPVRNVGAKQRDRLDDERTVGGKHPRGIQRNDTLER